MEPPQGPQLSDECSGHTTKVEVHPPIADDKAGREANHQTLLNEHQSKKELRRQAIAAAHLARVAADQERKAARLAYQRERALERELELQKQRELKAIAMKEKKEANWLYHFCSLEYKNTRTLWF